MLLAQLAAVGQVLNVLCFGIVPKAYAVLVLRAPARLGPLRFYSYAAFGLRFAATLPLYLLIECISSDLEMHLHDRLRVRDKWFNSRLSVPVMQPPSRSHQRLQRVSTIRFEAKISLRIQRTTSSGEYIWVKWTAECTKVYSTIVILLTFE